MVTASRALMAGNVPHLIWCWQGVSGPVSFAITSTLYRHLWRLERDGTALDPDGKLAWISVLRRSHRAIGRIAADHSTLDRLWLALSKCRDGECACHECCLRCAGKNIFGASVRSGGVCVGTGSPKAVGIFH